MKKLLRILGTGFSLLAFVGLSKGLFVNDTNNIGWWLLISFIAGVGSLLLFLMSNELSPSEIRKEE